MNITVTAKDITINHVYKFKDERVLWYKHGYHEKDRVLGLRDALAYSSELLEDAEKRITVGSALYILICEQIVKNNRLLEDIKNE